MINFLSLITELGGWAWGLVFVVSVSVILFWCGRVAWTLSWWLAVLGALATTHLLKLLIARPRPLAGLLVEGGFSFPSGHATAAVAVYGFLLFLWWRFGSAARSKKLLVFTLGVVLILTIGASRVYLGFHYLSDVLAGFAVGGLWLWLAARRLRAKNSTK